MPASPDEQEEQARSDRADITAAISYAHATLACLRRIEARHRIDLTGPAASALARAHTDEAMLELDVRIAANYLRIV